MAAEYAYQLNSNAVPVTFPAPSANPPRPPRPTIVPKPQRPRHTPEERRRAERRANVKVAKLFVVMAFAVALLGLFCNSFVARTNSRQELEDMKNDIQVRADAFVQQDGAVVVLQESAREFADIGDGHIVLNVHNGGSSS